MRQSPERLRSPEAAGDESCKQPRRPVDPAQRRRTRFGSFLPGGHPSPDFTAPLSDAPGQSGASDFVFGARSRDLRAARASTSAFAKGDEHGEWRNSARTAYLTAAGSNRSGKYSQFKGLCGRGSWIRTNDLQYPKLPRYQAALYPGGQRKRFDTRLRHGQQDSATVSVARIEQAMPDPIAGDNAVFLRGAAHHLQHPLDDASGRDGHGG